MKKKVFILIILALLIIMNPIFSQNKKIEVLIPLGPTIIPFSTMISENSDFNFTIWRTLDELVVKARDNKYDVIIAPFTTLVNLYNKGVNIKYLSTFNFASFYLISNKAKRFNEIIGDNIYIAQKGSTQDIIFNIYLQERNLKDKINLYYSTPQEIISLFIAGKIENALLPEPYVSMGVNNGGRIILDIQRVYREISKGRFLPITSIAVRGNMDKKEAQKIDSIFRENFKKFSQDPKDYIEKASEILKLDKKIIELSLKRLSFLYQGISIKNELIKYLEFIYEKAPQTIGNIPDEKFFTF